MKKNKTKEVSKQLLGRIRNKIEEFKRNQNKLKIPNYMKLYISTDKALEIYQTIDALQQLPPYTAVKKVDIAARKPNFGDRQIRRGFELLCRVEYLECHLEIGQRVCEYWIPKYKKKNFEITKKQLQIEREARKQAEKEVENIKQEKKKLFDKTIKNEINIKELKTNYNDVIEITRPYLDNLRYCESDEDWELLTKWFMKMQENKHYQEEAESQEEEYKFRYELSKEIDQDKTS